MDEDETFLETAGETDRYREYMINNLIEVTTLGENVTMNILQGRHDTEMVNAYISKLIHILEHLYTKIEGGGDKTKDLLNEFNTFRPWIFDPSLPVYDMGEGNRVPELFFLILRTYERLDLKSI